MNESCGTCRNHFDASPEECVCRAAPPVVFFVRFNDAGQPLFASTWPTVRRDAWCAAWSGQKRTVQ